jgi:hypothetical protein
MGELLDGKFKGGSSYNQYAPAILQKSYFCLSCLLSAGYIYMTKLGLIQGTLFCKWYYGTWCQLLNLYD